MKTKLSILTAVLMMAGCGAAPTTMASVKVYKSRGAIQCGDQGKAPEEMRRELVNGGIKVLSFACGTDGRMYMAMCGRPDDKINIFEIPESQLAKAEALSYKRLDSLKDAREIPCP